MTEKEYMEHDIPLFYIQVASKCVESHNHHTVVLLESPAIMSKIRLMPGIFNTVPNKGTLRRKFIATGRKPLEQKCNKLIFQT